MDNRPPSPLHLPPITAAAPGPLYRQIGDAIQAEIRAGHLRPGAPLPSYRLLAEQLLVSVITVKRAYEELERDGCIYRKQGLGTFVADAADKQSLRLRRAEAESALRDAVRIGIEAGMTKAELRSALDSAITGTNYE